MSHENEQYVRKYKKEIYQNINIKPFASSAAYRRHPRDDLWV